jgi:predicted nucleic acid-binding Zn ribbon protein
MTTRKGKPQRIGDTLKTVLGASGLSERVEQAQIIPEWPALVGKQIAAVTDPHHIARDGTLFVAVRTNAWMSELSLMEPQLMAALNAKAGRARITRIHWQLMR